MYIYLIYNNQNNFFNNNKYHQIYQNVQFFNIMNVSNLEHQIYIHKL